MESSLGDALFCSQQFNRTENRKSHRYLIPNGLLRYQTPNLKELEKLRTELKSPFLCSDYLENIILNRWFLHSLPSGTVLL